MTTPNIPIKLNLGTQKATFWGVRKKTDAKYYFSVSIQSSKKREDGIWDNIYTSFICSAEPRFFKILNSLHEKQDIWISGTLQFSLEKKQQVGVNGKSYNETIFTNGIIWISSIEISTPQESNAHKANNTIDNTIPF
jgi:hypothetical protein